MRRDRNFRKIFIQLTVMMLIVSCLSPLDRFSGYTGGQLVISGQISTVAESNTVQVARTSDHARFPEPVSDAEVVLMDDQGNSFNYVPDVIRGEYVLPGVAGVPGRTYQLRVSLPDGKTYLSVPEKMPLVTGRDQVNYLIEPAEYIDSDGIVSERDFVKIYTTHTLPDSEDPVFIKWHVEEVYMLSPTDFPDPFGNIPPSCYVAQQVDPQRIVLFSNDENKTPSVPDLLVVSRLIDPSFKERHYFTTFQSMLTRQAYEYWRKVDVVANQTGSIFDAPPARVKGNIVNVDESGEDVHGFFQATNQTFHRFFILPADLPYGMPIHCEYRADREYIDYPSECLNCESVRNSTYNRPPWF